MKNKGFTLVEVLLAMAISMAILAGVGYLYYSISMAWVSHKEGDLELQHQHSIFAFLEDQLTVKPRLPNALNTNVNSELKWEQLPESSNYDPVYISWIVEKTPSFLKAGLWLDDFTKKLYLKFDRREGLSLIWHPEDSKKIERLDIKEYDVEDYIYEFHLSSDITKLEYCYYDSDKDTWEFFEHTRNYDPKDRGLPDALKFEVQYKGEPVTRSIYLSFKKEVSETKPE